VDEQYYPHASTATVLYDPGQGTRHFEPWFALLLCDEGIVEFYSWLLLRHGIDLERGSRWGAHVTFVRGQEPARPEEWGRDAGATVSFRYSNVIHWTNGRHAWVDVWCPDLNEMRARLGLPVRAHSKYHLALGRLASPRANLKTDHGDIGVL
jgi:hypothetical protein